MLLVHPPRHQGAPAVPAGRGDDGGARQQQQQQQHLPRRPGRPPPPPPAPAGPGLLPGLCEHPVHIGMGNVVLIVVDEGLVWQRVLE